MARDLRYSSTCLTKPADLDRTFQALADKSRRTMVEQLALGPASVSELARPLAMSLAAVMQHVQVARSVSPRKDRKGRPGPAFAGLNPLQ